VIPKKFDKDDIFKYGSLSDLSRTLADTTLGFSKLSDYNDPFESEFSTFLHMEDTEMRSNFMAPDVTKNHEPSAWGSYKRMKDWIISYFSSQRVTCFSRSPVEPLMWAHYADKHKGVCYCFDKTVFDEHYTSGEVVYSSNLPKLHLEFGITKTNEVERYLENIILTKSQAWAYEEEFRFYIPSNEPVHKFNPAALKFVILGMRSSEKVSEAHLIVHRFNQQNNTDVSVLHANMSSDRFEMEINDNVTIHSVIHCPKPKKRDDFDFWSTGI
jgi:hypothetical protein